MAAEHTKDGIRTHRPLPSVDIPLLRDERRASRNRQMVLSGTVAALLTVGVLLALVLPRVLRSGDSEHAAPTSVTSDALPPAQPAPTSPEPGSENAQRTPTPATPTPPNATTDAGSQSVIEAAVAAHVPSSTGITTTTRQFGRAGGFRDALVAAGCTRDEAQELIAALERVVDFRHCHPEDTLTFERNRAGAIQRFQYDADRTHVYQAVREANGRLRGSRVEIPVERIRLTRGGYVGASLGDALDALGVGRSLVGVFVEVFEGRVNFSTQTREGDSFRILVDEERVRGEFLRYGNVHALEYTGSRAGTFRAYYFTPHGGEGDFYDVNGRALHGGWLRTPLRYDHISSPFDPRRMHPVLHRIMPHNGIDYSAGTGTPVWAAADGSITFAGERGANGNLVAIRHAGGYDSFYAHLSRIAPGMRPGVAVRQRQLIGYVGTTGRSTGPHLHFGLQHHGRNIDPARELNGPGRPLPASDMTAFRRAVRQLDAELARIPLAAAPVGPRTREPEPAPIDEGDEDLPVAPARAQNRAHR